MLLPCQSRAQQQADDDCHSGIFGYINYLVEKDRKYILDTLINGAYPVLNSPARHEQSMFCGVRESPADKPLPQVFNA